MNNPRFAATIVLALAPAIVAGEDPPPIAAPWSGAERSVVISILGEPNKAKRQSEGREVLTYRLVRLGPNTVPGPGQRIVDVPGIGPCVTTGVGPDPNVKQTTSYEPTAVDEQGRPVGGGMTTTQSTTVTYGKDGKREGYEGAPAPPPAGGKVKLELILGPDGRVQEWSTSPKS